MVGLINWLRTAGVFINIRKHDSGNGNDICRALSEKMGIDILENSHQFAEENAKKIILLDKPDDVVKKFTKNYFENSNSYVLKLYDEMEFKKNTFDEISWGPDYEPIWYLKWNLNGNIYNVVIDNEGDARAGWCVFGEQKYSSYEEILGDLD